MAVRPFSRLVLAAIDAAKIVGMRAGLAPHRFIGIWVVVVDARVFVRSWQDTPTGWRRAFLEEPRGLLQLPHREIAVRARPVKGERLLAAVDAAYAAKYPTPGSRKYVLGFARGRRRLTTTELLPR